MLEAVTFRPTDLGSDRHPFIAPPGHAHIVLSSSQLPVGLEGETGRSERLLALGQAACLLGGMLLASDATEANSGFESAQMQEHGDLTEEVSPERLLATGYAACFLSALLAVCSESQGQASDHSVAATVTLKPRWSGEARFEVALDVAMLGLDRGAAEVLVEKAHVTCPYPHVSREAVDVTLQAA